MSTAADPQGPPERSSEPLWHLVQFKMIQAFNEATEDKKLTFKCWPVFSRPKDDRYCNWIVVVVTDGHGIPVDATNNCRIQIDESAWWEAMRIPNPSGTILVEGHGQCSFLTYQIKVPLNQGNHEQPLFTPLEMAGGVNGGAPTPVFSQARMRWARLHLSVKSTPQLMDQIQYKSVVDECWKFDNLDHYHDIQRWGTVEEFEFEAAAIRKFNCQSVYTCWLILCHPSDDELQRHRSHHPRDTTRQQCIVIVASADPHEGFPKVGDTCDLGFAVKIPALDKMKRTSKNNQSLKREGVNYVKGVRVDNPHDQFSLDGLKWSNYSTFKVWVKRNSARDYSPLAKFKSQLDPSTLATHEPKPRITLDEKSSFKAHVWMDISETTMSVELDALETAVGAPLESRIGEAFSYIRTFKNAGLNRNFNLLRAFPHMQNPDGPNSQLPENLKALFQSLDDDQRHAYNTILSDLPCRVGTFPGGPGAGKTQMMLTISAMALSKDAPLGGVGHVTNGEKERICGPILLILEANRPANFAASRVVEHFERLGRADLRILRAYNYNYEGLRSTRRYLKAVDDDEESPDFNFDECFPTHRADHIPPRVRKNDRSDCLAPTLREAAQQYLAEHPKDLPLLSKLVNSGPDDIDLDDDHEDSPQQREWEALFSAVLARADFLVTTPVGAAKLAQHFHPRLVIFDEAARARELSTLVAIAHFPSAEAWLFTGTVEMTKPYVASYGNPNLWNPCTEQLRTSMIERCFHALPDMHRLSLNHQAYGNLHILSSDLFWGGQIQSALPSSERFPQSTIHLLEYCRNLASDPSLSIPRLLVHVKRPRSRRVLPKSSNKNHINWVVQRVIRDLVQDRHFRTTDGKKVGSIIVTTPYKAQFTDYRKEINGLMRELDTEHRLNRGHDERLHREVLVEARTADTVQGHSADVVVYDLVNSEVTSHVADQNRMCVALTRAKQAEIIVMESSMLGREGPAYARRRPGFGGSYIDLLYDHCKSNGQVITVDLEEDIHVEKSYTLQQGGARPGRDWSAVPRQLAALPPPLELPQDNAQVDAPRAVPASESQTPEPTHEEEDGGMFQSSEHFSFEMVRKAMELGLALSADMRKEE